MRTLGELRAAGFGSRSVRDELRANLLARLRSGEPVLRGLVGYDNTVVPQVVNAVLARQNFILLGLRGQAKSRILREVANLLDPFLPVLAGSELRDDPFNPISKFGRDLVARLGDDAPVEWVPRDERYVEKLATPDVTVADLIGDVDPIKAARLGTALSDDLTIHYGLLPRANRGVFAINELADLAPKVQVALFNVMQEGDVQIKGYPVRLPLDVVLVFSANPEDYTARGKIVTPLKDRIGSEIRTHYPQTVDLGLQVTLQEAWVEGRANVPGFVAELVEETAFQAREDNRVDRASGVSQRLPISMLELVASNAEQRAARTRSQPVARPSDLYAALPAVTGKLELEYEGEMKGADLIARDVIRKAAGAVLTRKLGRQNLDELVSWFDKHTLRLPEDDALAVREARNVPGLAKVARELQEGDGDAHFLAACELVLEGLCGQKRLARSDELGYTAPDLSERDRNERGRRPGRFN
ncbi:MAG TPA: sigma 54-interacting transcriptional regulator [Deinococcales bacterium]|nr:sigma 54-interacting transcriptional regulator [Deinococcales bacterium]